MRSSRSSRSSRTVVSGVASCLFVTATLTGLTGCQSSEPETPAATADDASAAAPAGRGANDSAPPPVATTAAGSGMDAAAGSSTAPAPAPAKDPTPAPTPESPALVEGDGELPDFLIDTGGSAETVDAANAAIDRMVRAYRDAPALSDTIVVQRNIGDSPGQPTTVRLAIGRGTDAMYATDREMFAAVGSSLFFLDDEFPDRYVELPLDDNLWKTSFEQLKFIPAVPMHFLAKYGTRRDDVLQALFFRSPYVPEVGSHRMVTDPDTGEQFERVILKNPIGYAEIDLDVETSLLRRIHTEYTPPNSPIKTLKINEYLTFSPQVTPALMEPIEVDIDGREKVTSVAALRGIATSADAETLRVKVGRPALDADVVTLWGTKLTLSAGWASDVAVYTFWRSSSVGSVRGMPAIRELAAWSAETDGVTFWPVNTLEVENDAEGARWPVVEAFWDDQGHRFDTIYDKDDSLARRYGVSVLPVTIVVAPGGVVSAIIPSIGDDFVDAVKAAVAAAGGASDE